MLAADFWRLAGPEPDLDEILQDPLVRAVMEGDHVAPEDLKRRCQEKGRELADQDQNGAAPNDRDEAA